LPIINLETFQIFHQIEIFFKWLQFKNNSKILSKKSFAVPTSL
jgi:hypothetical protein